MKSLLQIGWLLKSSTTGNPLRCLCKLMSITCSCFSAWLWWLRHSFTVRRKDGHKRSEDLGSNFRKTVVSKLERTLRMEDLC